MPRDHRTWTALLVLVPLFAATGCIDLLVGPEDETGRLSLSFRLADVEGTTAAVAPSASAAGDAPAPDLAVATRGVPGPRLSTTVTGSAGATLVLHEVRIVVGQFALERAAGDCDASGTDGTSDCERFAADPHLLQLSLGDVEQGEAIRVSEAAPADAYGALDFAVRAPGDALLAEIRAEGLDVARARPDRPKLAFGDWPDGATAFVSGAYDADGPDGAGAPVPFRIFFRGEAGAQVEFRPELPLVIRAGETTEASVVMSRDVWRASDDQRVLDLSQLDYDETGEVYELDPGMIQGFESVEFTG